MRYLARESDLRHSQMRNAIPPTKSNILVEEFSVKGGISGTTTAERNFEQIDHVLTEAMYLDQLPPFNISLSAFNEYGHTMRMVIHGVEILNSGSGTSIDDITIDTTCTFVATGVTRWHKQGYVDADGQFHSVADRSKPPVGAGSTM